MKLYFITAIAFFALAGCAGGSKKGTTERADSAQPKTEMTQKGASSEDQGESASKTSSVTLSGKVECSMKNDKRAVEVRKSGAGCELAYSKFGNEEIVATSLNGTEHCQKIADRIVGNLENAGFTCAK